MADKQSFDALHMGALDQARLYLGDSPVDIHSFAHPLGNLTIGIIAGPGKTNGNEDSAALITMADDSLTLLVADGVGGSATPRKASNTVVQTLHEKLQDVVDEDTRIRTAILDGIEEANRRLLELGTGTATTLIAADIRKQQVRTYHVGDSSAWLIGQRGAIKYQTTPHSPVGFGMEAGLINADEALQHDDLNIISNVIGSNDMRMEIGSEIPMASLDTLLLASDGLFDNLLPDEIIDMVRTGPLGESMTQLCELAQRRMAGIDPDKPSKPDDFSAILFRPAG